MTTKKPWTLNEESVLANCLEIGCLYSDLEILLPNRTQKSILRKALYLGYSSSQKDDEIVFTYGIKRRNRRKEVTRNVEVPGGQDRKNLFHIITKSVHVNNMIDSMSRFVKRWRVKHAS